MGPATDKEGRIKDAMAALARHPYWGRVPEPVLARLCANAGGDMERVCELVAVTERLDCLDDDAAPMADGEADPDAALASLSATLDERASQAIQSINHLPDGSQQIHDAIDDAMHGFRASIVCNPLMLTAYVGLARLFTVIGRAESAAETCRAYDAAERRLVETDDASLGPIGRVMREEIPELRAMVARIRKTLGIQ